MVYPVGVRAISFDVGHTLLRAFPSFGELFRRCCSARDVTLGPSAPSDLERFADTFFKDLGERGITYSASEEQSRTVWIELYTEFLTRSSVDPVVIPGLSQQIFAAFVDHGNYQLYDDALGVLREFRDRGFIVGITSNWEAWLADLLASKNMDSLIDFQVISGVVGFEKPDPRIFDVVTTLTGLPASSVLHVGDSLHSDVRGANAVGMPAVLLDREDRYGDLSVPRVRTLDELLTWPTLLSPA